MSQILDSQGVVEGDTCDVEEDAGPIGDKPFITVFRINSNEVHFILWLSKS